MITLYHHGSSVCAAKVRIVLAEKSLPWDGIYVDILRGDQFDPAYALPVYTTKGKTLVLKTRTRKIHLYHDRRCLYRYTLFA